MMSVRVDAALVALGFAAYLGVGTLLYARHLRRADRRLYTPAYPGLTGRGLEPLVILFWPLLPMFWRLDAR
jgi:hypothetical protein